MIFNQKDVDTFYHHIKQKNDYPEAYITELFLIGKLTVTETIKKEVSTLIKKFASETIGKAFKVRNKIPSSDKKNVYDKTIQTLIAYGLKAEDLDLGKMFELLGYKRLNLSTSSFLKLNNENILIFKRFNRVKYLNIEEDTFETGIIPEEIGELTNLEELEISGDYKALPNSIGKLTNLKKIELEMSYLKEIPDSFGALVNLEELSIKVDTFGDEFNKELQIPTCIGKLTNLKILEIGYLTTSIFTDEMLPPNLEELSIYRMHGLTHLPEQIGNLTKLRSFELHVCDQIKSLPKSMAKLKNLEVFHIGSLPKLEFIDGNIVFLPTINSLRLIEDIKITEPEHAAINLTSLKVKNPSYLVHIINKPELFPDLETLNIHEISEYDSKKGIGYLPNLKKINLFRLSDLPKIWGDLVNCPNLKEIELTDCEFVKLPDLRSIKSLEKLKITRCKQLEVYSDELPLKLDDLEMFNIAKFTFGDLPIIIKEVDAYGVNFENFTNIGDVFDVKKLKLHFHETSTIDNQCKINNLPASLEKIKNLETFIFSGQVTQIETDFSKLPKLNKLQLKGIDAKSETNNSSIEYIVPFQAPNLTFLNITNYIGDNLKEILTALPQISTLSLEKITNNNVLPVSCLKNIKKIELKHCAFNDFTEVSKEINSFDAYFCENLTNNSLETICNWENLKELRLKFIGDNVTKLPESLKKLSLNFLDLYSLKIKEIPAFIGEIKTLKTLCLDGFYLEELPSSIAHLSELEYLSINHTHFNKKLTDDFKNLNIKELRMFESKFSGNNMKEELYEVLLKPNTTIKVRYFSFEEN